ncbi:MAG: hypothetical protein RDU20_06710 [Desulfomonilaceae bacterium]|nr:hypothetical protein [Desulfomonilaceae bacterium]
MAQDTSRNDLNEGRIGKVQAILIGWFPALVALVLIPLDLYLPNQDDFGYNLALLAPWILMSAVWGLALTGLLWTRAKYRLSVSVGLFYFGIFLALSDLLFPVRAHWGSIETPTQWTWNVGVPLGVEALIAVGLVFCFRMVPFKFVQTVGSAFVAVLLVVQLLTLPGRISPDSIVVLGGKVVYDFRAKAPSLAANLKSPNIYHFVLDGFGSSVFEQAIATGDTIDGLDGFTFFRNARANYIWTNYSMASYLTGTFYCTGSVGQWMSLRKTDGLFRTLTEAGYSLTQYIPIRYYMHANASRLIDPIDVASKEGLSERIPGTSEFADLWFERVMPQGILGLAESFRNSGRLKESLNHDSGPERTADYEEELARFLDGESSTDPERKRWIRKIYTSLPLMKRLIVDESTRPNRGQYVFLHSYISHEPHDVLDKNCRLVAGTQPRDQAACALKFVREFTDTLKELGRYHESLIIIHADHGSSATGPSDPYLRIPVHMLDEIASVTRFPADLLCNRTFPLLAIKPPNTSGHRIRTSMSPVQLADIPPTICSLVGLQEPEGVGETVFSLGESDEREIHMFFGFARQDERGEVQWGGKQLLEGELCHISFSFAQGYRKYPRIPFQWQ